MKKILLGAALILSAVAAFCQQPTVNRLDTVPVTGTEGLEGLIVEVLTPSAAAYAAGVPAGALTYRVFVNLINNRDYSLLGYTGNDAALIPFEVTSTSPLFNFSSSGFGGQDGSTQNTAFWSFPGFEAMRYDSYGADGRIGSSQVGIPFSMDTDGTVDGVVALNPAYAPLSALIMPVSHPIFLDNATSSMTDLNGGMFIVQAKGPTIDNMVFVMQFTTAGDITFSGTVSVRTPSGVMVKANNVGWSSVVLANQPPVVSVLAPASANKDQVVTFTADASDPDGQVASVDFMVNGSSIGVDTDGTDGWSYAWTAAGGPTVEISALATDNGTPAQNTQSEIRTMAVVDTNTNAAPVVNSLSPSGFNIKVGNDTTFVATVSDADGSVSSVNFRVTGAATANFTDNIAPFEFTYSPALSGSYILTAIATDNGGAQSNPETATFNAISNGNVCPTQAAIASPSAGTYNLNDIVLTANVSDCDATINLVEFKINGSVIGSDNDGSDGWSFVYSPRAASNLSLTARALGVISAPVIISFANAAPVITSLTPSEINIVTGSEETFIALANDADGTVSSVLFTVSGAQSASYTDNNGSDGFSFSYTPSVAGEYTLTAIATDNNGSRSESVLATFTVVLCCDEAYSILSVVDYCSSSDVFCMPVIANVPVQGVIGYDVEIRYDNLKVLPTGVVTAAEELISNRNWTSYSYNIVGDTLIRISLFFNGSAPTNTSFNGRGEVFCVEFTRNYTFGNNEQTEFTLPQLIESYPTYVNIITANISGTYSIVNETEFNGVIEFWNDSKPLSNDITTEITPAGNTHPIINPNEDGSFVWDITNGTSINIVRDIDAATSVMPVINGYDAYLTSKVTVEDNIFKPNVYQIIAMDVNRDGYVTAGDISQISQRTVAKLHEFLSDWLFIPLTTRNTDFSYRISVNYPKGDGIGYTRLNVPIVVDNISLPVEQSGDCANIGEERYKAVLIGDVDGSYTKYAAKANPVNLKIAEAQNGELVIDLSNAVLAGNTAQVPVKVYAADAIHSIDIHAKTGTSITLKGIVDHAGLEETVNMESSYFLLSAYSKTAIKEELVFTFNFELQEEFNKTDIVIETALINGKPVELKVIGNINASTGIETPSLTNAVIYPNPASNICNVVFAGVADVALINSTGQIIELRRAVIGSTTFDLDNLQLPAGIYTIMIGQKSYKISVIN